LRHRWHDQAEQKSDREGNAAHCYLHGICE
jgi:hypothetical protein